MSEGYQSVPTEDETNFVDHENNNNDAYED